MEVIYNLTKDYTTLKENELITETSTEEEYRVNLTTFPVLTEYGICYMTNSKFTVHLNAHDMIHGLYRPNHTVAEKYLIVQSAFFDEDVGFISRNIPTSINVHLHGFGEVMNPVKSQGFQKNIRKTFSLGSIELVSEKGLKEGSLIRQRNCRYPEENYLEYYPVYTETLCLQECRLNLVHKLCGCIPHFYPRNLKKKNSNKRICHYKELKDCLEYNGRIGEFVLEVLFTLIIKVS